MRYEVSPAARRKRYKQVVEFESEHNGLVGSDWRGRASGRNRRSPSLLGFSQDADN